MSYLRAPEIPPTPDPLLCQQVAWKEVRSRDRGHKSSLTPHPVTRNSFAALEDECEDGKTDKPCLPSRKTLVVSNSQLRYLDRAFYARDRKHGMIACFPGRGERGYRRRVKVSCLLSALGRVGTIQAWLGDRSSLGGLGRPWTG